MVWAIEITPEEIFIIHPKIRWAGLATDKGQVLFCQMRRGVRSITPEEDDRALLELRARYIAEVTQQVSNWAGPAEYITIAYEKFVEVIVLLEGRYVVLTVERDVPAQTIVDIVTSIRAIKD